MEREAGDKKLDEMAKKMSKLEVKGAAAAAGQGSTDWWVPFWPTGNFNSVNHTWIPALGHNVEDKKIESKTKKRKELQASPYQLAKENEMLPKAKQEFNEESYQNTSYHKK